MMRKDIGGNVTEITHDGVVERWLFVKKVVDASEVSKEVNYNYPLTLLDLYLLLLNTGLNACGWLEQINFLCDVTCNNIIIIFKFL